RERQQGPRPPRLRGLDPDVGEPGGLRADGHVGRVKGSRGNRERSACRRDGVPRGRPGTRVSPAAPAGRRSTGRIRADSRIDSPPRRRSVARGGCRPDPWMDEGRGPRGRCGSRFGRTRLVTRALEGAEAGGTATDPSRTEFVEVAAAAAACGLEALLDEALADRATGLE